ncbi:MAG: 30S ribosomal protein S17 [Armatimonadota bacterium]|nr:MAG: 30S ribosomal protein S17 [Armatimonadota bacterium]
MAERTRAVRKQREGVVVSDKMDKTVVVAVEQRGPHPLYRRVVKRTTKLVAQDDENRCGIGDRVTVTETRPLSKRKRWRVTAVIEKAK